MPGPVGARIDHIMLPVTDLDVSIHFYSRLFQMVIIRFREPKEGRTRAVHIGYEDNPAQPTIELIETPEPADLLRGRIGGHICFHVENLVAFHDAIKTDKIPFEAPSNQTDAHDRIWMRDPDGHMLEIVSRTR